MKSIKLLFVALILIGVAKIATAQDVIVKKDNTTILSKVVEINSTEIKYKKWSNQDGPTYVININEVNSINYQNGEIDKFTEQTKEQPKPVNQPKQSVANNQNNNTAPVVSGYMRCYGNGLSLNGRSLSDREVRDILGNDGYSSYSHAHRQIKTGKTFTTVFIVSTSVCFASYFAMIAFNDPYFVIPFIGTLVVSDVSLPLMIAFNVAGKTKMNRIADNYNKQQNNHYSLNVSPSLMKANTFQNQSNYGIGLTLSMNF